MRLGVIDINVPIRVCRELVHSPEHISVHIIVNAILPREVQDLLVFDKVIPTDVRL